jgi:hypothetical protein
MKRDYKIMHWVSALIAFLALYWFCVQVINNSSIFAGLGINATIYVLIVTILYVVTIFISGLAWTVLLNNVGEYRVTVFRAISICCTTQIAKYLPGNVAHHLGRVVIAKRHGLSMNNTVFTMFIETVWVIAIAGSMALVAILFVGNRVFGHIPQIPPWWFLTGLVSILLFVPLAGHRLFERFGKWWSVRRGIEFNAIKMPPMKAFWIVGLLYVLNYIVLGLILQVIATRIFAAHGGGLLLLSGIFAVAWIVGFITPGAPAGIGVREMILVAALTPVYNNETAIGIAATLRVVTVLGDVLGFIVGIVLVKISTVKF